MSSNLADKERKNKLNKWTKLLHFNMNRIKLEEQPGANLQPDMALKQADSVQSQQVVFKALNNF